MIIIKSKELMILINILTTTYSFSLMRENENQLILVGVIELKQNNHSNKRSPLEISSFH